MSDRCECNSVCQAAIDKCYNDHFNNPQEDNICPYAPPPKRKKMDETAASTNNNNVVDASLAKDSVSAQNSARSESILEQESARRVGHHERILEMEMRERSSGGIVEERESYYEATSARSLAESTSIDSEQRRRTKSHIAFAPVPEVHEIDSQLSLRKSEIRTEREIKNLYSSKNYEEPGPSTRRNTATSTPAILANKHWHEEEQESKPNLRESTSSDWSHPAKRRSTKTILKYPHELWWWRPIPQEVEIEVEEDDDEAEPAPPPPPPPPRPPFIPKNRRLPMSPSEDLRRPTGRLTEMQLRWLKPSPPESETVTNIETTTPSVATIPAGSVPGERSTGEQVSGATDGNVSKSASYTVSTPAEGPTGSRSDRDETKRQYRSIGSSSDEETSPEMRSRPVSTPVNENEFSPGEIIEQTYPELGSRPGSPNGTLNDVNVPRSASYTVSSPAKGLAESSSDGGKSNKQYRSIGSTSDEESQMRTRLASPVDDIEFSAGRMVTGSGRQVAPEDILNKGNVTRSASYTVASSAKAPTGSRSDRDETKKQYRSIGSSSDDDLLGMRSNIASSPVDENEFSPDKIPEKTYPEFGGRPGSPEGILNASNIPRSGPIVIPSADGQPGNGIVGDETKKQYRSIGSSSDEDLPEMRSRPVSSPVNENGSSGESVEKRLPTSGSRLDVPEIPVHYSSSDSVQNAYPRSRGEEPYSTNDNNASRSAPETASSSAVDLTEIPSDRHDGKKEYRSIGSSSDDDLPGMRSKPVVSPVEGNEFSPDKIVEKTYPEFGSQQGALEKIPIHHSTGDSTQNAYSGSPRQQSSYSTNDDNVPIVPDATSSPERDKGPIGYESDGDKTKKQYRSTGPSSDDDLPGMRSKPVSSPVDRNSEFSKPHDSPEEENVPRSDPVASPSSDDGALGSRGDRHVSKPLSSIGPSSNDGVRPGARSKHVTFPLDENEFSQDKIVEKTYPEFGGRFGSPEEIRNHASPDETRKQYRSVGSNSDDEAPPKFGDRSGGQEEIPMHYSSSDGAQNPYLENQRADNNSGEDPNIYGDIQPDAFNDYDDESLFEDKASTDSDHDSYLHLDYAGFKKKGGKRNTSRNPPSEPIGQNETMDSQAPMGSSGGYGNLQPGLAPDRPKNQSFPKPISSSPSVPSDGRPKKMRNAHTQSPEDYYDPPIIRSQDTSDDSRLHVSYNQYDPVKNPARHKESQANMGNASADKSDTEEPNIYDDGPPFEFDDYEILEDGTIIDTNSERSIGDLASRPKDANLPRSGQIATSSPDEWGTENQNDDDNERMKQYRSIELNIDDTGLPGMTSKPASAPVDENELSPGKIEEKTYPEFGGESNAPGELPNHFSIGDSAQNPYSRSTGKQMSGTNEENVSGSSPETASTLRDGPIGYGSDEDDAKQYGPIRPNSDDGTYLESEGWLGGPEEFFLDDSVQNTYSRSEGQPYSTNDGSFPKRGPEATQSPDRDEDPTVYGSDRDKTKKQYSSTGSDSDEEGYPNFSGRQGAPEDISMPNSSSDIALYPYSRSPGVQTSNTNDNNITKRGPNGAPYSDTDGDPSGYGSGYGEANGYGPNYDDLRNGEWVDAPDGSPMYPYSTDTAQNPYSMSHEQQPYNANDNNIPKRGPEATSYPDRDKGPSGYRSNGEDAPNYDDAAYPPYAEWMGAPEAAPMYPYSSENAQNPYSRSVGEQPYSDTDGNVPRSRLEPTRSPGRAEGPTSYKSRNNGDETNQYRSMDPNFDDEAYPESGGWLSAPDGIPMNSSTGAQNAYTRSPSEQPYSSNYDNTYGSTGPYFDDQAYPEFGDRSGSSEEVPMPSSSRDPRRRPNSAPSPGRDGGPSGYRSEGDETNQQRPDWPNYEDAYPPYGEWMGAPEAIPMHPYSNDNAQNPYSRSPGEQPYSSNYGNFPRSGPEATSPTRGPNAYGNERGDRKQYRSTGPYFDGQAYPEIDGWRNAPEDIPMLLSTGDGAQNAYSRSPGEEPYGTHPRSDPQATSTSTEGPYRPDGDETKKYRSGGPTSHREADPGFSDRNGAPNATPMNDSSSESAQKPYSTSTGEQGSEYIPKNRRLPLPPSESPSETTPKPKKKLTEMQIRWIKRGPPSDTEINMGTDVPSTATLPPGSGTGEDGTRRKPNGSTEKQVSSTTDNTVPRSSPKATSSPGRDGDPTASRGDGDETRQYRPIWSGSDDEASPGKRSRPVSSPGDENEFSPDQIVENPYSKFSGRPGSPGNTVNDVYLQRSDPYAVSDDDAIGSRGNRERPKKQYSAIGSSSDEETLPEMRSRPVSSPVNENEFYPGEINEKTYPEFGGWQGVPEGIMNASNVPRSGPMGTGSAGAGQPEYGSVGQETKKQYRSMGPNSDNEAYPEDIMSDGNGLNATSYPDKYDGPAGYQSDGDKTKQYTPRGPNSDDETSPGMRSRPGSSPVDDNDFSPGKIAEKTYPELGGRLLAPDEIPTHNSSSESAQNPSPSSVPGLLSKPDLDGNEISLLSPQHYRPNDIPISSDTSLRPSKIPVPSRQQRLESKSISPSPSNQSEWTVSENHEGSPQQVYSQYTSADNNNIGDPNRPYFSAPPSQNDFPVSADKSQRPSKIPVPLKQKQSESKSVSDSQLYSPSNQSDPTKSSGDHEGSSPAYLENQPENKSGKDDPNIYGDIPPDTFNDYEIFLEDETTVGGDSVLTPFTNLGNANSTQKGGMRNAPQNQNAYNPANIPPNNFSQMPPSEPFGQNAAMNPQAPMGGSGGDGKKPEDNNFTKPVTPSQQTIQTSSKKTSSTQTGEDEDDWQKGINRTAITSADSMGNFQPGLAPDRSKSMTFPKSSWSQPSGMMPSKADGRPKKMRTAHTQAPDDYNDPPIIIPQETVSLSVINERKSGKMVHFSSVLPSKNYGGDTASPFGPSYCEQLLAKYRNEPPPPQPSKTELQNKTDANQKPAIAPVPKKEEPTPGICKCCCCFSCCCEWDSWMIWVLVLIAVLLLTYLIWWRECGIKVLVLKDITHWENPNPIQYYEDLGNVTYAMQLFLSTLGYFLWFFFLSCCFCCCKTCALPENPRGICSCKEIKLILHMIYGGVMILLLYLAIQPWKDFPKKFFAKIAPKDFEKINHIYKCLEICMWLCVIVFFLGIFAFLIFSLERRKIRKRIAPAPIPAANAQQQRSGGGGPPGQRPTSSEIPITKDIPKSVFLQSICVDQARPLFYVPPSPRLQSDCPCAHIESIQSNSYRTNFKRNDIYDYSC